MSSGKINLKTILILVILLLVGVLGVLGMNTAKTLIGSAAAGVEPKGVLAKPDIDNSDGKEEFMARVEWTSEKPAMGIVEYGTTPASLLLRAAEASQTTNHSVELSPLKANTSYYFRIKVGEEVFDNNGIPYSFKTKGASQPVVTPLVTLMPTVVKPTVAAGGACDRSTDYDKNGVVNSLDFLQCQKQGGATAVPTGSCNSGTDFDGNGVANSLDVIKCLQNKKQ